MNWGIVCRPNSKKASSLGGIVRDFLKEHGTVYLEKQIAKELGEHPYSLSQLNQKADIVITIGGDGTILKALESIEKPIFAINSGGIGFLSEVESKYATGGLQRLIDGEYNIEERAKLKITLDGKRILDAANEVTVQTSLIAKILYLKLFVDDELIETMGADGVIVASPTGSTSYSLSVGGPMMDPAVEAMIIAPIAPFKLSARPWIIPLKRTIQIKILAKSKESQLVIDGHSYYEITPESEILITGSEKKARFVRFGETFYQMVRLKLMR
jgi:NAD+ kinase